MPRDVGSSQTDLIHILALDGQPMEPFPWVGHPMLKYEYIFETKYTEAVVSAHFRSLLYRLKRNSEGERSFFYRLFVGLQCGKVNKSPFFLILLLFSGHCVDHWGKTKQTKTIIHGVKLRTIYGHDTMAIWWVYEMPQRMKIGGKDVSCYSNKIQPVCLLKCPYDH